MIMCSDNQDDDKNIRIQKLNNIVQRSYKTFRQKDKENLRIAEVVDRLVKIVEEEVSGDDN